MKPKPVSLAQIDAGDYESALEPQPLVVVGDIPIPESVINSTIAAAVDAAVSAVSSGTTGPYFPSSTQVNAIGESTTANAGYETNLASYTGLTIINQGVSGQGITDELMMRGAIRPRISLQGGVIPSGSFNVPITSIDPAEGWRKNGSGSFTFGVIVNGLTCTLTSNLVTNSFSLNGTNPGGPITVADGTPIQRNPASLTPTRRIMFESLRNNVGSGLAQARDMLKLIYGAQSTQIKQVLFIGLINGSSEGNGTDNYARIVAANSRSAEEFGSMFYDIRRDFIDRGLEIRGITPTPGDLADIAADKPPRSIWETGGGIHPNADGYLVKNYLIAEKMLEIGWVNSITLPPIPDPEPEPGAEWVTLTSDSFNRADGGSTTTDAANGGTPLAPVTVDSQIGIIGNQWGAISTTSAERYAYYPAANQAAIECDYLGGGKMQLRLCREGTTYYQFEVSPNSGTGIYETISGTKTVKASAAQQIPTGSRVRFEAYMDGSSMVLRGYRDGLMVVEWVDASPLTGTQVAHGSPTSSSAFRIDNLVIQTASTP